MNDHLIALLGSLAQALGGSLGWAIVIVSLGVRSALLPLTIGIANRARRNQEVMRRLQPQIEQLRKRHDKNPEILFRKTRDLYRENDCNLLDIPALAGSFLQLPVFGMIYGSIRSVVSSGGPFLWIKSLSAPDFLLTLVILSLSGLSFWLMPSASQSMKGVMLSIQLVVTFFLVWKLSAGLGLYWASSSMVGVAQTVWLRNRCQNQRRR